MRDGQLAGVRVLDLGIWRPAPYATQLLAELGADVIKVEPPGGDPMRQFPSLFAGLSGHKRSIELDLKQPDARKLALDLAGAADVVVEGYRPGVAARLGLGWEQVRAVNPRAVFCSVSGYGQDGPYAPVPGHDINYQALSGMLAELGSTPPTVPLADVVAGMAAAFAICAALVRVARTGDGEQIDVAMADVLAAWVGTLDQQDIADRPKTSGGRGTAGYGVYETADGSVALGIVTEDVFWRALCDALDLPHLRDVGTLDRFSRKDELDAQVSERLKARPRDEVVAALSAAGVPVSPVLVRREVMALEHFQSRGVSVHGAVGHPVTFRNAPALRPSDPAPPLETVEWLPR